MRCIHEILILTAVRLWRQVAGLAWLRRQPARKLATLSRSVGIISLAGIMFIGNAYPQTALAADDANVMIIFDGSGSMWGNLPGESRSKIKNARAALHEALSQTNHGQLAVGLTAYGNKRSRDCSDASIMHNLSTFDRDTILDIADNISPRGRGPLTNAMRETINEFKDVSGPKSIIILHDGIDNCEGNPCAAARDFKRQYRGSPIHVISMGLDSDDFTSMSCIARITGGKHFDARDADAVTSAMNEAWKLAKRRGGSRTASARVRRASNTRAFVPPPPPAYAGFEGPGLFLTAGLGPNSAPLDLGVSWKVFRADGTALHEETSAQLALPLPPGGYVIEVKFGSLLARQPIQVPQSAPVRGQLSFNAGTMMLAAHGKKNGAVLENTLFTIVKLAKAGSGGAGKFGSTGQNENVSGEPTRRAMSATQFNPLILTQTPQEPLLLSAGRYLIKARYGTAAIERYVQLSAGGMASVDMIFNTGIMTLRAVRQSDSSAIEDVIFTVFEDAPTLPAGRREVARSASPLAVLSLPAGSYTILARAGAATAQKRVVLKPEATLSETITIPATRLRLNTTLGGSPSPTSQPIVYKLISMDGEQAEPIETHRRVVTLSIPPGRYRVESQVGLANALLAYEIELQPGQTGHLTMAHQAGLVRLRLVTSPGAPALGNVFWEIADITGKIVRRTGRRQPDDILAVGTYIAKAQLNGRSFQQRFEVLAGSRKTIELIARRP